MSNLTHCDGPGCDKTKPTKGAIEIRLCDGSWIRVDQGEGAPKLDFHDRECLANWTTGKPRAATDSEPCLCMGSQIDPHAKGQHGGMTEVTGL